MGNRKTGGPFAACLSCLCLVWLWGCGEEQTDVTVVLPDSPSGASCLPLSFDQNDAVGAFLSLPTNPTVSTVVEMGPARIRALTGERVVWVFRNPSDKDMGIELYSIWHKNDPLRTNVKSLIFAGDAGGLVPVEKNCGYGFLIANVRPDAAQLGVCARDTLNYNFFVHIGAQHDSLGFPFDPELVVEGQP